jgi:hypothetical protein
MPRRVVSHAYEDKLKCYNKDNKEISDPDEVFLFLKSNVEGESGLVTLCLTYEDAKLMQQENHAPYIPNGFTENILEDINYFITSIDQERENKQTPKYDADLSDLQYVPRVTKIKDVNEASHKIFQQIKDNQIVIIETDDGLRIQRGKYLHSPDDDTPAYIDYKTGTQHFYDDGRLLRKKLASGGTIWYSQRTGKKLDFPLDAV